MDTIIRFYGACGTVTGSRYFIEYGGDNILIDCGLFQGDRDARKNNWDPFPVSPREIKRVALTHAHIDHTGYLPRLVKNGYSGKVLVTGATADLLQILFPDAAMIQEEDAAFYNRKKISRHEKALPLFNTLDAKRALSRLEPHKPDGLFQVSDGISLDFRSIGHILGASMIYLEVGHGSDRKRILFSGDIGRYDVPILKDPLPPPEIDYLVIESTYGDRLHQRVPTPIEELKTVVNRIYEARGVLLIPSFAVGRTQDLLYDLAVLEEKQEIPEIPVYIDSPMAIDVTKLYMSHTEYFDSEISGYIRNDRNFMYPKNFQSTRSPAESQRLNGLGGPMIIISASGMLTGGRIRHHIYQRISDPTTELLFVGYQAVGTRGRELQEGAKTTYVFKEELPVNARISTINGFSAHADYEEMLRWLSGMQNAPKKIFIVHGEDPVRPVWAEMLKKRFPQSEVIIPNMKDQFDL